MITITFDYFENFILLKLQIITITDYNYHRSVQNMIILHIKLNGMANTATCKHIFCPYTPSTPGVGSKVKTFFF